MGAGSGAAGDVPAELMAIEPAQIRLKARSGTAYSPSRFLLPALPVYGLTFGLVL